MMIMVRKMIMENGNDNDNNDTIDEDNDDK